MTTSNTPLISLFLATINPGRVTGFLDNLSATAADPSLIEVLIKADEGDQATIDALEAARGKYPFTVNYIITPRERGYFSLHHAYDQLLRLSAASSYFCAVLTDEIRFTTPGWDKTIASYVGFFPDHIFRLKFSQFRNRNYYYYTDCIYHPDNYPMITKKWLQIAGGWGEFWGPDSWHQAIDFYLGKCRMPKPPFGMFRSVPLQNVHVDGQADGQGVESKSLRARKMVTESAVYLLKSYEAKLQFCRIAHRLYAAIIAEGMGHTDYVLYENPLRQTVRACLPNGRSLVFLRYDIEATREDFSLAYALQLMAPVPPKLIMRALWRAGFLAKTLGRKILPRRLQPIARAGLDFLRRIARFCSSTENKIFYSAGNDGFTPPQSVLGYYLEKICI